MRKINLSSFQVATSETARDINRRIVLDMIRTRQPISRADLARHSGLQRSTVSAITEQLIAEQWITEGALGHIARGRRPRFLNLNNERAGIIGVNVRPRVTTLALTDLNARFVTQDSIPTSPDPQVFLNELIEHIQLIRKFHPQVLYEGIGVSLPGRVDRNTSRLVFAPNLGWRDVDIKTPLENATNLPVEVGNAANACALFEMWFGKHGDEIHDMISLTVAEGIGTVIAGEAGYLIAVGATGHDTFARNVVLVVAVAGMCIPLLLGRRRITALCVALVPVLAVPATVAAGVLAVIAVAIVRVLRVLLV